MLATQQFSLPGNDLWGHNDAFLYKEAALSLTSAKIRDYVLYYVSRWSGRAHTSLPSLPGFHRYCIANAAAGQKRSNAPADLTLVLNHMKSKWAAPKYDAHCGNMQGDFVASIVDGKIACNPR